MLEFFVFVTNKDGKKLNLVSLLDPNLMKEKRQIPYKAVVGILDQGAEKITPDTFTANSNFRELLHELIAREAVNDPGLKKEAKRIKDGYVFVIDARTPTPWGEVPPHDIIGRFRVDNKKITEGGYQPNNNHMLVSPEGLFQLHPALEEKLMEEINNL